MPVSESIRSNITHLSLSEAGLSLSSQDSVSPGMDEIQPVLLDLAVSDLPEQQAQAVQNLFASGEPEISSQTMIKRGPLFK